MAEWVENLSGPLDAVKTNLGRKLEHLESWNIAASLDWILRSDWKVEAVWN